MFQITPVVAAELTDTIAVSVGPTIMMGKLSVSPFAFAAPDDANGDMVPTYPAGDGTRFHWGGGFQAGIYYADPRGLQLGLPLKSKQWFEDFTWNSADELGLPRFFHTDADYPMIVSLGAGYAGLERLLIAVDVRYYDWDNTALFGDAAGFDAMGRLTGLGWRSTWAVSLGAQYEVNNALVVRAGYSANQNPITDATAGFNVASPLIMEHAAAFGATLRLSEHYLLNASYHHAFQGEVSGAVQGPTGPVPGTNVNYRVSADALTVGVTARF
jgi:long-chain fatty acid transport protein